MALCRIPGLIEQILKPPMGGPGLSLYINLYNTIFLFVFLGVLYAVVRSRTQFLSNLDDMDLRKHLIASMYQSSYHIYFLSSSGTDWLNSFSITGLTDAALAQGSCLVGQTARIPLVADAADQQVR